MPSSNVTTTCEKPNFETVRMLFEPRQAADRLLDRERDPLLDFLRPQRRRDRVDLHLHRRGIGKGIDVEIAQRQPAEHRRKRDAQDHQQPMPQRKVDDPVQHANFLAQLHRDRSSAKALLSLRNKHSRRPGCS